MRASSPSSPVIDRLDAWERVGIGAFSDRRLRRIRALSRGQACTSMGPRAVAAARAAALCGRMPRQCADCVQVPLRSGRIPIVTAGWLPRRPSRRPPRARMDRERRVLDARPARPRRRRHHARPTAAAARRLHGARPGRGRRADPPQTPAGMFSSSEREGWDSHRCDEKTLIATLLQRSFREPARSPEPAREPFLED